MKTLDLILLWLGLVGCAAAASLHTATATPSGHNPGVREILQSLPPPGQSFEVEGYFQRGDNVPLPGWGSKGLEPCPRRWTGALTDQPYPIVLTILNETRSNAPSPNSPYLLPVRLNQERQRIPADLPYHARLRGHLGDAAMASCEDAARIIVIEEVKAVYEQDSPPLELQRCLPADFAAWNSYHDETMGYTIRYPNTWQRESLQEPNMVAGLKLVAPEHSDFPMYLRINEGETHYDQYSRDIPARLLGNGWGIFQQGNFPEDKLQTQHLAGHFVNRTENDETATDAVLFNAYGRTYELSWSFPLGLQASQELLTNFTAIVETFRFDDMPGPTPTAPIKTQLGKGPFLSEQEAFAKIPDKRMIFLKAELMSERAARQRADACNTFMGHPDGVWVLTAQRKKRVFLEYIDAVTGEFLCGEQIITEATTPLPLPPGAPTPAPTRTPMPTATEP